MKELLMDNKNYLFDDDALFHFTNRTSLLEGIISSGVFLLNHLKNTNDPQEYKKYNFHSSNLSSTSDILKLKRIKDEINVYFKTHIQIGCFCVNKEGLRNTWKKPKIWSDFGDGHKGVSLIFSKKALESELKRSGLFYGINNVTYSFNQKRLPVPDLNLYKKMGAEKYCNQYIKKNFDIITFKDLDYETEDECRSFIISKENNRFEIDLKVIIKGLIIGDRFPDVYNDLIENFSDSMNINLYKLEFTPGLGYDAIPWR